MKRAMAMFLLFTGIAAIVFGIMCFNKPVGVSVSDQAYGGDAYTGIQRAGAATANNVKKMNEILCFGFGSVLVIGGAALCFSGLGGMFREGNGKQVMWPENEPVSAPNRVVFPNDRSGSGTPPQGN